MDGQPSEVMRARVPFSLFSRIQRIARADPSTMRETPPWYEPETINMSGVLREALEEWVDKREANAEE